VRNETVKQRALGIAGGLAAAGVLTPIVVAIVLGVISSVSGKPHAQWWRIFKPLPVFGGFLPFGVLALTACIRVVKRGKLGRAICGAFIGGEVTYTVVYALGWGYIDNLSAATLLTLLIGFGMLLGLMIGYGAERTSLLRSASVTAVAVLAVVTGSAWLPLLGLRFYIAGMVFASLASTCICAVTVIAGLGTGFRRNWARIAAIVLAGPWIFFGCFFLSPFIALVAARLLSSELPYGLVEVIWLFMSFDSTGTLMVVQSLSGYILAYGGLTITIVLGVLPIAMGVGCFVLLTRKKVRTEFLPSAVVQESAFNEKTADC
jgi:hypothetical protein